MSRTEGFRLGKAALLRAANRSASEHASSNWQLDEQLLDLLAKDLFAKGDLARK